LETSGAVSIASKKGDAEIEGIAGFLEAKSIPTSP
jgi:hypothetical protein